MTSPYPLPVWVWLQVDHLIAVHGSPQAEEAIAALNLENGMVTICYLHIYIYIYTTIYNDNRTPFGVFIVQLSISSLNKYSKITL